jgi:hypothetical protein
MILLRKILPSPNCLDVPYKVSPQSFLIALTVSSPHTGSFAKANKKNVRVKTKKVQKRFFGFLRECISNTQGIRVNPPNNLFALVSLLPNAP